MIGYTNLNIFYWRDCSEICKKARKLNHPASPVVCFLRSMKSVIVFPIRLGCVPFYYIRDVFTSGKMSSLRYFVALARISRNLIE